MADFVVGDSALLGFGFANPTRAASEHLLIQGFLCGARGKAAARLSASIREVYVCKKNGSEVYVCVYIARQRIVDVL